MQFQASSGPTVYITILFFILFALSVHYFSLSLGMGLTNGKRIQNQKVSVFLQYFLPLPVFNLFSLEVPSRLRIQYFGSPPFLSSILKRELPEKGVGLFSLSEYMLL
ncbi:hypothetical protein BKA61DRAFT_78924 [Leptodontidium sp. MPI-SDFR-AT-0119]|nr:hypothetical protein BKA61DRAFT_78924 [Leptodontidium sp. MPI-SDFR-AT-0119]